MTHITEEEYIGDSLFGEVLIGVERVRRPQDIPDRSLPPKEKLAPTAAISRAFTGDLSPRPSELSVDDLSLGADAVSFSKAEEPVQGADTASECLKKKKEKRDVGISINKARKHSHPIKKSTNAAAVCDIGFGRGSPKAKGVGVSAAGRMTEKLSKDDGVGAADHPVEKPPKAVGVAASEQKMENPSKGVGVRVARDTNASATSAHRRPTPPRRGMVHGVASESRPMPLGLGTGALADDEPVPMPRRPAPHGAPMPLGPMPYRFHPRPRQRKLSGMCREQLSECFYLM